MSISPETIYPIRFYTIYYNIIDINNIIMYIIKNKCTCIFITLDIALPLSPLVFRGPSHVSRMLLFPYLVKFSGLLVKFCNAFLIFRIHSLYFADVSFTFSLSFESSICISIVYCFVFQGVF